MRAARSQPPSRNEPEFVLHCRDHPMLASFKRPRAYCFVEALPLTATGKKMHFRLREQAPGDAAAGRFERPSATAV